LFCTCGAAGGTPWQVLHAPVETFTVPFRCVVVTAVVVVAGWQVAHAVDVVCGAGGGFPWHDVQLTVASTTLFWCSVAETVVVV
jgi:hypothetical protein